MSTQTQGKQTQWLNNNMLPRFANYMGLSLRMQYQFDNPTCGTYSVFDSHSRDVTRNTTPEGAAVLLTFDSIEDLSHIC